MSLYFKPLRRKIGVTTLVLACLFMGGWFRSLITSETLAILCIAGGSSEGAIAVRPLDRFRLVPVWREGGSISKSIKSTDSWKRFQCYIDLNRLIFVFPYWSIVVPLTLLSAWLLLSKPRNREKSATTPT